MLVDNEKWQAINKAMLLGEIYQDKNDGNRWLLREGASKETEELYEEYKFVLAPPKSEISTDW